MNPVLVVCYSYSGVTRRLAELLCSRFDWPVAEVRDAHPRSGWPGTFHCVLDSLLRRRPAILYEGPDPGGFRTVVLMAPIWMYRLAGPMRSFVWQNRDSFQHVVVISTMGSAGASNALAEVARILGKSPTHAAAFTTQEVEDGTCTTRLFALADQIQPASMRQAAAPAPTGSQAGIAAAAR